MARHSIWFGPLVSVAILSAVLPPVANATVPGAVVLRSGAAAAEPVQAGQVLANDGAGWVDVAFADGSSIVLGPGARVVIEGIEEEGETGRRVIALRHEAGTLRVALARGVSARVVAPQGTTVLQRGTALIALQNGTMTATLLSGGPMTVSTALGSETIRRPGFATSVVAGSEPGSPQRQEREALAQAAGVAAPLARSGGTEGFVPAALAAGDEGAQTPPPPATSEVRTRDTERVLPQVPPPNNDTNNQTQRRQVTLIGLIQGQTITPSTIAGDTANSNTSPGNVAGTFTLNPAYVLRDDRAVRARRFPAEQDNRIIAPSPTRPTSADNGSADIFAIGGITVQNVRSPGVLPEPEKPEQGLFITDKNSGPTISAVLRIDRDGTRKIDTTYNPASILLTPFDVVSIGTIPNGLGGSDVVQRNIVPFPLSNTRTGIAFFSKLPHIPSDRPNPVNDQELRESFLTRQFDLAKGSVANAKAQGSASTISDREPFFFLIDQRGPAGQVGERLIVFSYGTPVSPGGKPDDPETIGPRGEGILPPNGAVWRYGVSDGLNADRIGEVAANARPETLFGDRAKEWTGRNDIFTAFNAFRPEATFINGETGRGDTHLLVIGESATPQRPSVMRVDLQVGSNRGESNASVTVGFMASLSDTPALAAELVGSARLANANGVVGASQGIHTAVGSLGDGSGAYAATGSGWNGETDTQNQKRVGYLVLGEIDPVRETQPNPPIQRGTVAPALPQQTEAREYTFTRLASGVETFSSRRSSGEWQGFAAAVVESFVRTGSGLTGTVYELTTRTLGDVSITTDSNSSTLGTTLFKLAEAEAGRLAASNGNGHAAQIAFDRGANNMPRSAFANDTTFAALATRPEVTVGGPTFGAQAGADQRPSLAMASVNGDLVNGLPRITPPGATEPERFPASNEHVQWGFFLGDLVNTNSRRDHIGMGFWVAGRPVGVEELRSLQQLTGQVQYTGGMIGNVVDGQNIRTATGGFAYTHNFAARTGGFSANFDGATWSGIGTTMAEGSNVFSGSGTSAIGGRDLSLQGAFFNRTSVQLANPVPALQTAAPNSVGGTFAVTGPAGQPYSATGVFVGNK